MNYAAQRAVITGAASGIGYALAKALADQGAQVLMADIQTEALQEAAHNIGHDVLWARCDVTQYADVEALAATAQAQMGGCDYIFANAGVISSGKLIKMKPAEIDWILNVNVRGAWNTIAIFAQMMLQQEKGGHIILTGSEHSLGHPHPGAGIYTASKHAVLGLAEALRAELPPTVKVSIFCPGLVATGLGGGRPADLTQHPRVAEAGRIVQSRGMSAQEAAQRALEGVAAGAFYIVTHPHSLGPVEKRYQEITQAYAQMAPWFEGAEQWDVNRVMADVAAEMKKQQTSL